MTLASKATQDTFQDKRLELLCTLRRGWKPQLQANSLPTLNENAVMQPRTGFPRRSTYRTSAKVVNNPLIAFLHLPSPIKWLWNLISLLWQTEQGKNTWSQGRQKPRQDRAKDLGMMAMFTQPLLEFPVPSPLRLTTHFSFNKPRNWQKIRGRGRILFFIQHEVFSKTLQGGKNFSSLLWQSPAGPAN